MTDGKSQMRRMLWLFVALAVLSSLGHTEDLTNRVKKAVERSTLNQTGAKPFHLKAELAPSREEDNDSGRTGEIEIWWASPGRWKRELRSPDFHQIEVVNDGRDWQKSEGDYFPEWLRETAAQLVDPVPALPEVLEHVKTADDKRMFGQNDISWVVNTGTLEVHNIQRYVVAFHQDSGLLFYTDGFGWGAEFKDYANFHGRMVARTVNVGTPQVTAKVVTLEDLRDVPAGFFDARETDGDAQPLQTVPIDEISLRKNLLPTIPLVWPPVKDGPLEGNVTTWIVIDRKGKVREFDGDVSENSTMIETGKDAIRRMQFTPFLVNGIPVQVLSQFTLPFKTTRPTGSEKFDSAQTYFERGRKVGFPSAGTGGPYVLRAEFELRNSAGEIEKGRYEDTWLSDLQWRREAWFGDSHLVRSRSDEKRYRVSEGQHAGLLQTVFRMLEPIPASDTFHESDWRMNRDPVNESPAVRVLTGYESPDGKLDPVQVRGYWFDDSGLLLKTHFGGIETRRSDFAAFGGVKVARSIDVFRDGNLLMRIRVTEIGPADNVPDSRFKLPGHEWERIFTGSHTMDRQFTDEVR